jgi:U11/U12 small nuclear ribonucleoprotein SNRNP65
MSESQRSKQEGAILESNEFRKALFERLNGISSHFGISYPINPKLKYEYPPINPIICQNIVNSLINYPRFYVQTLHLMNKMNLPCPLVPYVREPSMNPNVSFTVQPAASENIRRKESSDSELESELETDTESIQKNNHSYLKAKSEFESSKKLKSIIKSSKFVSSNINQTSKSLTVEDVFEKNEAQSKQLKEKIKFDKIEYDRVVIRPDDGHSFPKIAPINQIGAMETNEANREEGEDDSTTTKDFISRSELEKNRMTLSKLRELPVFKNYDRGETNSRLYLKNLSKKVTESELKFIYGRYIDWSDEVQRNAFDIRLMQEGRMKGQAFLTFPSEGIANKALNETIGYLLDEKPLVVQFARSAKPNSSQK